MGYNLVKLPQAYWAKSTQVSAVVSMKRVSRPGGRVGIVEEAAGAWVWAGSGVHRAERSMSVIARLVGVRPVTFLPLCLFGEPSCGAGNSLLLGRLRECLYRPERASTRAEALSRS